MVDSSVNKPPPLGAFQKSPHSCNQRQLPKVLGVLCHKRDGDQVYVFLIRGHNITDIFERTGLPQVFLVPAPIQKGAIRELGIRLGIPLDPACSFLLYM